MRVHNIQTEAEDLIKMAQEQPGITELMTIYGRYDELMEQTRVYMSGNNTFPNSTVSTNSTPR